MTDAWSHYRQTNTAEERHILGRKGRLDCKKEREAKKEKQNSKGKDLWTSRATAGQETGLYNPKCLNLNASLAGSLVLLASE